MTEEAGYDLGKFNLPPAKAQATPQKGNDSSAGGFDLGRFELPPGSLPLGGVPQDGKDVPSHWVRDGLATIELPGRPGRGAFGIERARREFLQTKNIPAHIERQVLDGFRTSARDARLALNHYVGVVEGVGLMDREGLAEFKKLASSFSSAAKPQEFFEDTLKPFLRGLTPKARK
jgi:hypothetical protein